MSSCSPLNLAGLSKVGFMDRKGPGVRLATPRAGRGREGDSSGVLGVRSGRSLVFAAGDPRVVPYQAPCPYLLVAPAVSSSSSCTFSVLIALICASICAMRSSAVTGGAPLPSPPVSIPCSAPVPLSCPCQSSTCPWAEEPTRVPRIRVVYSARRGIGGESLMGRTRKSFRSAGGRKREQVPIVYKWCLPPPLILP